MNRPHLSVVDYGAWEKGYTPPCEHRLIDALSYRDAKVKFASSVFSTSWWVVAKGEFNEETARDIIGMMQLYLDGQERRSRLHPSSSTEPPSSGEAKGREE
jgi:hypothetical protein